MAADIGIRKRVLLVDDDPSILRAVGAFLRRCGFDVLLAPTSEGAIELAHAPVDIVLSDAQMPGMRGPALLVLLKGMVPGAKLFLMTGGHTAPVEAEARRLGLGDIKVFSKPLDYDALLAAFGAAMPTHHKVLVVEDDPNELVEISGVVIRCGYEIVSVSGPEEALRVFAGDPDVDIVVTEYLTTPLTGFGLAARLQQCGRRVEILLYTREQITRELADAAAEAGIAKVVTKPDTGWLQEEIIAAAIRLDPA